VNATLGQIAQHLRRARRVLLVAHVNPDADALGSALATAIALETLGTPVQVTFPDYPFEVPLGLRFLPRADLIVDPDQALPADAVISMDASSGDRVGRLLPVGEAADTFIAVDHHASFVAFAPIVHLDAARPATGLLALDLIDELGVPLTPDIALCLYAAISSDTGSFRFPTTTPETLRAAARLMETGMDFAGAARAMFDTKSRDFLALQADVMSRLELVDAGGVQVAVVHVDREDRTRFGIAFTQVESLIDTVRTVEGAEVAVVLKEDDHGLWRVSSRSLGSVDVGRACTSLGGGGHVRAAGFTGGSDPEQTLADFLAAIA
jgi:phosphoesterase RecJ-like protein